MAKLCDYANNKIETKERLAYNTVYRVQLLLFHDEKLKTGAYEIYSNAIGKHYAEYLKMAGSTEPMDMGISFETAPTQEVKENIMAGYPHFYFHNCREVAERFVDMAEKISKNLSM